MEYNPPGAPHKLTLVCKETKTGVCSICGVTKVKIKGNAGATCWTRVKQHLKTMDNNYWAKRREAKNEWKKTNATRSSYRRFAKPKCERCDFAPKHKSQIDVHHLDRDRDNNHISNLISLCANCHRLEHAYDRFCGIDNRE